MEWLQVETTLPDHRKIARLASELKLSRVHAVGLVVCFWLWAVHNREDGVLEDIDTDTIARVTDFKGKPEKLVSALCSCGLLDRLDSGYVIHDWEERVGLLIDKRNQQREQTRDRVQKYRARKKQESETACNDDVTRYGNDGVTRYGNKRVTRDGNASNGDVTPLTLHNTTLHNTTSSIEDDEDDEDEWYRAHAREDEDAKNEIASAIKRECGRNATPAECQDIYTAFTCADIPICVIPAAIKIAASNGVKNLAPYVIQIASSWRPYHPKTTDEAYYLNDLLRSSETGKTGLYGLERAQQILNDIRAGDRSIL